MAKHIHIHVGKNKTKDRDDPKFLLSDIKATLKQLETRANRFYSEDESSKLKKLYDDIMRAAKG